MLSPAGRTRLLSRLAEVLDGLPVLVAAPALRRPGGSSFLDIWACGHGLLVDQNAAVSRLALIDENLLLENHFLKQRLALLPPRTTTAVTEGGSEMSTAAPVATAAAPAASEVTVS